MDSAIVDSGSFRDPAGHVYIRNEKIYRTVNKCAVDDFDFVESSGICERLVSKKWLIKSRKVNAVALGFTSPQAQYVLEHPAIKFVSYPYEWSFCALKSAALLHLDIHLMALNHGVTLSDASAFNIQFNGSEPIFIDRLSLVRYQEGAFWSGHRQFCEQFLNPLLLRSLFGICHNAWFRGSPEGVSTADIKRLLRIRHLFSWNILAHVVLHDLLQHGAAEKSISKDVFTSTRFPKACFIKLLSNLRKWIQQLEPKSQAKSLWHDYAHTNSYTTSEREQKQAFISEFSQAVGPDLLLDIGCNCGDYSQVALNAGAKYAVGIDFDQDALDLGISRAKTLKLPLQFLYQNTTNPSPAQGWQEQERKGFMQRSTANASLALAVIHHMVIARNIPVEQFVDWLMALAPAGVLEFVPKSDPMVQQLLKYRQDIFPGYTQSNIIQLVERRAHIVKTKKISDSGRILIWFDRLNRQSML